MQIGHWQSCQVRAAHKKVNVKFWKTPDYKYDFCVLCLYEIQKQNGTLQTAPIRSHTKQECKPEKDTL